MMKRRWKLILLLGLIGALGVVFTRIEYIIPSASIILEGLSLKRSSREVIGTVVGIVTFLAVLAEATGFNLRYFLEKIRSERSSVLSPPREESKTDFVTTNGQASIIQTGDSSRIEAGVIYTGPVSIYHISSVGGHDQSKRAEAQIEPFHLVEEWFYNRENEISIIEKAMGAKARGARCISVHGFAGIGKSALLREVLRQANKRGVAIVGGGVLAVAPHESLAQFIRRVTRLNPVDPDFASEYEVINDFLFRYIRQASVLAIDEFPVHDSNFIAQFNWFLEVASHQQQCDLTVLTASRKRPSIKATLPVDFLKLRPLALDTVKVLVDQWTSDPIIRGNTEDIFQVTQGHPQLIKFLCKNPEITDWKSEEGQVEFDILTEVWSAIRQSDLKEPTEMISVISQFSPEFEDRVADALITDWPQIRLELVDRSLVEIGNLNAVRMHALLSGYVYKHLSARRARVLHSVLGDYYVSRRARDDHMFALYHYVRAERVEAASNVLTNVRNDIRFNTFSSQTEEAIHSLLRMTRHTEPHLRAKLLEDLGFMHCLVDAYDTAEREFINAKKIYVALADAGGQAWCNHGLGIIYRMRSDFRQALESFSVAEQKFSEAGDIRGLAYALRERSEILKPLGRYRDAYKAVAKAHELSRSVDDPIGTIACLRGIADLERAQYKLENARIHYDEALRLSREANTKMNEAYALDAIASLCRLRIDYQMALENSRHAIEILVKIGDRAGLSFARFGLAEALRMEFDYEASYREYTIAQTIAQQLRHPSSDLLIALGISELFRANGLLAESKMQFKDTLARAEKYGFKLLGAHAMLGMAEVARLQGAAEPRLYDRPFEVYAEMDSRWGMLHSLIGKGLSAGSSCNNDTRAKYFAEALEIAKASSLDREVHLLEGGKVDNLHALCFPFI